MMALLQRVLQAIVDAAYPRRCLVCGTYRCDRFNPMSGITKDPPDVRRHSCKKPTVADEQWLDASEADEAILNFDRWLRPYVCRACRATFTPILPPICVRCGTLFHGRTQASHLCGECLRRPGRFTMARALGVYENVLMALIHHLKYRGKIQLARPLGRCLFAVFIRYWGEQTVDLVIPVPLHGRRIRRRGFNQAGLLIKDWPGLLSERGGNPPAVRIGQQALRRQGRTASQSGLGRKQRQTNLKNTMIASGTAVAGKHVVVIDDVLTTGATANECARALLKEGAKRVDLLTLARVLSS